MSNETEIIRYQGPEKAFEYAEGRPETVEAVDQHVESHIGELEWVSHEVASNLVHIDIRLVRTTELGRDFWVLATSGMSDRPMSSPPDVTDSEYAELVMCLPGDWQIDEESMQELQWGWPLVWMRHVARFPHLHDTWLWDLHSLPNGDPPQPLGPGTELCGSMLAAPAALPRAFRTAKTEDGRRVHFFQVYPLYAEEMDLKVRDGAEELLERFDRHGISDLVDMDRKNVAKGGSGGLLKQWFSGD